MYAGSTGDLLPAAGRSPPYASPWFHTHTHTREAPLGWLGPRVAPLACAQLLASSGVSCSRVQTRACTISESAKHA